MTTKNRLDRLVLPVERFFRSPRTRVAGWVLFALGSLADTDSTVRCVMRGGSELIPITDFLIRHFGGKPGMVLEKLGVILLGYYGCVWFAHRYPRGAGWLPSCFLLVYGVLALLASAWNYHQLWLAR